MSPLSTTDVIEFVLTQLKTGIPAKNCLTCGLLPFRTCRAEHRCLRVLCTMFFAQLSVSSVSVLALPCLMLSPMTSIVLHSVLIVTICSLWSCQHRSFLFLASPPLPRAGFPLPLLTLTSGGYTTTTFSTAASRPSNSSSRIPFDICCPCILPEYINMTCIPSRR